MHPATGADCQSIYRTLSSAKLTSKSDKSAAELTRIGIIITDRVRMIVFDAVFICMLIGVCNWLSWFWTSSSTFGGDSLQQNLLFGMMLSMEDFFVEEHQFTFSISKRSQSDPSSVRPAPRLCPSAGNDGQFWNVNVRKGATFTSASGFGSSVVPVLVPPGPFL